MKKNSKFIKGFSIAELTVAMGIFFIITAMVTVSQRRFGGNILISNLAYDVGLGIRQAQVYGLGVRAVSGTNFKNSYGVHFFAPPSNYFVLFVDDATSGDGKYNTLSNNSTGCISNPASGSPECISFFKIQNENVIQKFCVVGNTTVCTDSDSPLTSMDIMFKRPDPEPTVKGYRDSNDAGSFTSAYVIVQSPQGLQKTVNILASGQISIK